MILAHNLCPHPFAVRKFYNVCPENPVTMHCRNMGSFRPYMVQARVLSRRERSCSVSKSLLAPLSHVDPICLVGVTDLRREKVVAKSL